MNPLQQLIRKEAVLQTAFDIYEDGETDNKELEKEAKAVLETYKNTYQRDLVNRIYSDVEKIKKEIFELQKIPNCEMFMRFCVDAIKFFRTGKVAETEEEKMIERFYKKMMIIWETPDEE
jgi:uncharacterized protein (UPF0305 family)